MRGNRGEAEVRRQKGEDARVLHILHSAFFLLPFRRNGRHRVRVHWRSRRGSSSLSRTSSFFLLTSAFQEKWPPPCPCSLQIAARIQFPSHALLPSSFLLLPFRRNGRHRVRVHWRWRRGSSFPLTHFFLLPSYFCLSGGGKAARERSNSRPVLAWALAGMLEVSMMLGVPPDRRYVAAPK